MTPTVPGNAAKRIQAAFRGHLVRRELVTNVRLDFEEVMRRVEAPLRSVIDPCTSPFPKGELGWKSSSSLSPPSVLDRLDDGDDDDASPVAPMTSHTDGTATAAAAAIDAVSVHESDRAEDVAHDQRTPSTAGDGTAASGVGDGIEVALKTEATVAGALPSGGGGDGVEENASGGRGHGCVDAVADGACHSCPSATDVGAPEVVSVLQQELAWAQAALDERRQHLRRMRLQRHQQRLQQGGVGLQRGDGSGS